MAALGPCAALNGNTFIIMNEVTTVAAAYALSGFTTISGTTANVSAPANNNAATGTTTAAAGLTHAFLNAANLANTRTGTANVNIVNNAAQASSLNGIVPQAQINALANSLQSCVASRAMPQGVVPELSRIERRRDKATRGIGGRVRRAGVDVGRHIRCCPSANSPDSQMF